MKKRLELTIFGQVQGVGFRYGAAAAARSLGLVGWVANQPDGTVRLVAEGEAEALQKLLVWCRHFATVENIESRLVMATGEFSEFTIKFWP